MALETSGSMISARGGVGGNVIDLNVRECRHGGGGGKSSQIEELSVFFFLSIVSFILKLKIVIVFLCKKCT